MIMKTIEQRNIMKELLHYLLIHIYKFREKESKIYMILLLYSDIA